MRLKIDDITINVELAGSGLPLLLLHGFTGSVATWASYSQLFAPHRQTIAIDLIGHGRSDAPSDPKHYRMERCIADMLAVLDALDVERADVLGYSMGGRVALHLAAASPQRVQTLVLESSSPGIADPVERQARVVADDALAGRIERDGLEAFVDYWERLPLFASQAALPVAVRTQLRAQRLQNSPIGLANSLRGMGAGWQEPLWERLESLAIPTLLIVGELDVKYRMIARDMAAMLPDAQMVIVPDAGHAVHLDQPVEFGRLVLEFLCSKRRTT